MFDTRAPGGTAVPELVLSLTPRRYIAWVTGVNDLDGNNWSTMAEVESERILPPDVAFVTTTQGTELDGAASAKRKWVVRSHQFPMESLKVHTAYSDTQSIWRRLPDIGLGAFHCAAAPLGDTTAMIVHAGEGGLAYAIAEGSRWEQQGVLDARPLGGLHPRLRFRPSGGLWLLWTDREWVHVSCYRDSQWFRGDSLQGVHPPGETFWAGWCDLTLDGAERPVLAWGDLGYGYTYRDVGMVSFPTNSGWMPGEEIPGSDNMFLTPLVARDRNGDVWAVWRTRDFTTSRWTHTYVSSVPSRPIAAISGRQRLVSWTLSEPAPESRWTIWRALGSGPFEQAGEVRAGSLAELAWTDTAPPEGPLRYRVRRESVDLRYQLDTEEALWSGILPQPLRFAEIATPFTDGMHVELAGAAPGVIELALYDLQGRRVHQLERVASGTGQDTLELRLSGSPHPSPGVYFLVARDASGRSTPPAKLVLLR